MIVAPNHKKNVECYRIQVWLIGGQTLIIGKTVERKAFLANPKHQYHVSQREKCDCSAHNKKNGDYYEYPSLSCFTVEH